MAGRTAQSQIEPERASLSVDALEALASGASLRGELVARAARLCIPLNAQIETTARCNLRCVHCFVAEDHTRPAARELSLARQLRLVDELADAGCMFLTLTGGEVSLKKGWLRLVEAARRRRMSVTILTNGTLLTEQDAEALARLKVRQVSISIYGDTAELHDGITGVPGSFARSVAAIRFLRVAGVRVRMATVLMNQNVHCFDGVRRLADNLGCEYRFEPTVRPMSDGDAAPLRHRLPADALHRLYADPVIGPRTAEGKWKRLAAKGVAHEMNACAAGVSAVFVDAAGGVFACPGFMPGFGSVRRDDFAAVWGGEAAQDFRRSMREPVVECMHCDDRQYCLTRCACLAAMEDGSLSGPSTRACELARMTKQLCEDAAHAPHGASDLLPLDAGGLGRQE